MIDHVIYLGLVIMGLLATSLVTSVGVVLAIGFIVCFIIIFCSEVLFV